MKKTFIRSFFKNIVHSLSRLLSIVCIVILGVGFLVGLLTSAPNVENSIDHYYDQYNVSDIDIMSTLGVDEKDKEFLLENIDEIENIKLESRNDMYVTYNNDTLVAKVIDYDFDSIINKIELKEGRLPENGDEIVVNISNNWLLNLQIGSKVTIDDHQYTIVGKVLDPNYFDKAKVTSSLGKGYLEAVIYRDAKYIDVEYYTDIFITIKGAEELDAFSSRYDDLISNVTTQIDNLKDEIKEYKFQAIRDEIYSSVYQAVYEETSKSVTSQAQAAAKEQITSLIQSQVESSVTSSIEKQITEEVTIRGIVLSGYENKNKYVAALMTGLFFGILHLDPQQFLYAAVLGFILALVVRITNSIFSSMIIHFIINGTSVTMAKLVDYITKGLSITNQSAELTLKNISSSEKLILFIIYGAIAVTFSIFVFLIIYALEKLNSKRRAQSYNYRISEASEITERKDRVINIPFIITIIVYLYFMITTISL